MQLEEEALRDRREREQLERNIRQRDAAATKKVKFYMKMPLATLILSWEFGYVNNWRKHQLEASIGIPGNLF